MSESLITNFKTIEIIEETAKYFKNVAIPSGVLVKSTGQGLVQSCRAIAQLLKILRCQSFTSLMAHLRQDINRVSSLAGSLMEHFLEGIALF